MSPLRRRLIEELQLQRKAEATIEAYVAAVAELAKFAGRSPDRLEVADVRKYFLHLIVERRLARSTVNQRILDGNTLGLKNSSLNTGFLPVSHRPPRFGNKFQFLPPDCNTSAFFPLG